MRGVKEEAQSKCYVRKGLEGQRKYCRQNKSKGSCLRKTFALVLLVLVLVRSF